MAEMSSMALLMMAGTLEARAMAAAATLAATAVRAMVAATGQQWQRLLR